MADLTFPVASGGTKKLVDAGDGTHAEQVLAHPPFDLMTDGDGTGPNRRLRVDQGSTGFWAGREARTFHEISVTTGTDLIIKAVNPVDFILLELAITIVTGELKVYTLLADGTEGGTFGTTWSILPANTMTSRPTPYYTPQMVITSGGTYTGGTVIDQVWIKTDANVNKSESAVVGQGAERGIVAGTYYYRLTATSNVTGLIHARWEERPSGV